MIQEESKNRGYAVGVQMFDWIRERQAPYIDKTKYVWQMVSTNAVNFFLSRPRRFGKSLLVDTLRCYFEGRKELFEGLYIYNKEREWKQYPVIRIDLSRGKYYEKERLHPIIDSILHEHEECWGVTTIKDEYSYDARLTAIIQAAYKQAGERVVILIDEYDAPMLDSITKPDLQDYLRERIRSLFSPLKEQAKYLRFVFLTGISKFLQLSVFSELNNLQQLTFSPDYEAVCGITEEELLTHWKPDIEHLMDTLNRDYARWGIHYSYNDVVTNLKAMYDGYHFSDRFTDVYCPWSLVNAFAMGRIENFWFSTGTPSMLINVMRQHHISIQQIEHFRARLDRFDAPTERIADPIPVLFQSGYLTLKEYNPVDKKFTLGFPNGEVREGFATSLYKYYMEDYVGSVDTLGNAFTDLRLKEITIEDFIETIRRWYAGIPYSITDRNQNEQLYQSLIYAALMGYGADVTAESQTSDGRMDIVLKVPDAIYIIELKYGKSADEAVGQIIKKGYAVLFATDSRPVSAIGLNISEDRRTIDSYKIVELTKKRHDY
jgi:hypothetical protein